MVKWAGELVTKYSVGKDGKTARERLKGKPSSKPLAQFGECVMYLPPDTPATEDRKIENKMRTGIWLGVIDRTEEAIIGTEHGVVKCRTIKRMPEGQQWDGKAIKEMRGSVQQPTPGIATDRIPTGSVDSEGRPIRDEPKRTSSVKEPSSKPKTRLVSAPRRLFF